VLVVDERECASGAQAVSFRLHLGDTRARHGSNILDPVPLGSASDADGPMAEPYTTASGELKVMREVACDETRNVQF
jgi:hypothetical protein